MAVAEAVWWGVGCAGGLPEAACPPERPPTAAQLAWLHPQHCAISWGLRSDLLQRLPVFTAVAE